MPQTLDEWLELLGMLLSTCVSTLLQHRDRTPVADQSSTALRNAPDQSAGVTTAMHTYNFSVRTTHTTRTTTQTLTLAITTAIQLDLPARPQAEPLKAAQLRSTSQQAKTASCTGAMQSPVSNVTWKTAFQTGRESS